MEIFQSISHLNKWHHIWPEISLGIGALCILLLDLLFPRKTKLFVPIFAFLVQVTILLILLFKNSHEFGPNFSGLILHSSLGETMRIFFLISSILVSYLGLLYFRKVQLPYTEFYTTIFVATASLMLLTQSTHFLMLFVALESFSVCLFVLISYCRKSTYSLEAGLKYLIMAALSSSLLLFGIVLLYGVVGAQTASVSVDAFSFNEIKNFLSIQGNSHNTLVILGVILILCGIAFKIGLVPFQIWIPDVYQGAPTPVTAFLAVASKAAGIVILINLIQGPFGEMKWLLLPLGSWIAIITILFGNITALPQTNVKRLMGLSGVSHAGYMLIGVMASYVVNWAVMGVVFYLFTYLLGSFAIFCVMSHMSTGDDAKQELEDYERQGKANPFLGVCLTIGVGSLAGIPPLGGFIAKVLLFIAAYKANLFLPLFAALLGVVISIYYYFGWIREYFFVLFKSEDLLQEVQSVTSPITLPLIHRLILFLIAAFTLILGIYQGNLSQFIFF